jgi:hypothetical protein
MFHCSTTYPPRSAAGLQLQHSTSTCSPHASPLDPSAHDVVEPSAAHPFVPEALSRTERLVLGALVDGGGGGLRGCLDGSSDGILLLLLLGRRLLDRDTGGLEAEDVHLEDCVTENLGDLCRGVVRHCGGEEGRVVRSVYVKSQPMEVLAPITIHEAHHGAQDTAGRMLRGRHAAARRLYCATPPRGSRLRRNEDSLSALGATHSVVVKLLELCGMRERLAEKSCVKRVVVVVVMRRGRC